MEVSQFPVPSIQFPYAYDSWTKEFALVVWKFQRNPWGSEQCTWLVRWRGYWHYLEQLGCPREMDWRLWSYIQILWHFERAWISCHRRLNKQRAWFPSVLSALHYGHKSYQPHSYAQSRLSKTSASAIHSISDFGSWFVSISNSSVTRIITVHSGILFVEGDKHKHQVSPRSYLIVWLCSCAITNFQRKIMVNICILLTNVGTLIISYRIPPSVQFRSEHWRKSLWRRRFR
jgi:hypothetical protein